MPEKHNSRQNIVMNTKINFLANNDSNKISQHEQCSMVRSPPTRVSLLCRNSNMSYIHNVNYEKHLLSVINLTGLFI